MLFVVWIVLRWVSIFCDSKLPSFSIKFIFPDENFTCENVATSFSMSMKWMRFPKCTHEPSLDQRKFISLNSKWPCLSIFVSRPLYRLPPFYVNDKHIWMPNFWSMSGRHLISPLSEPQITGDFSTFNSMAYTTALTMVLCSSGDQRPIIWLLI